MFMLPHSELRLARTEARRLARCCIGEHMTAAQLAAIGSAIASPIDASSVAHTKLCSPFLPGEGGRHGQQLIDGC